MMHMEKLRGNAACRCSPSAPARWPKTCQPAAPCRRGAPVVGAAGTYEPYSYGAPNGPSDGGYIREGREGGGGGGYQRSERGGRGGGRGGGRSFGGGGDRGGYRGERSYAPSEDGADGNLRRYGPRAPRGDRSSSDRSGSGYERGGYERGGDSSGSGGGAYSRGGPRGGAAAAAGGLSEEARAQNARIDAATSWRELNAVALGSGGRLDPFQLVGVLIKASRMKVADNADEQADFQQFVAAVYGLVLDALPAFKARQLASAVQAVAALQLYNEQLVTAILQRCVEEYRGFQPAQRSMLLRGCAALGVAPPQAWMSQYFERPSFPSDRPGDGRRPDGNLQKATADDMVNLLEALLKLGLAPPAPWLSEYVAVVVRGPLVHLGPREYLRLLLGLAACGWRPAEEETFARLLERCFPAMGYMNVDQLVQLAWAFTQFQTPLPAQWGVAYSARLKATRRFLRPSHLGSIMYSLAYLRMPPPADLMGGVLDDLRIQYDDATGDDLASVAMAMAQFQYRPRDEWLDSFLITLRRKLPTCSGAGLSNVMQGLPSVSSGVRLNEVVADAQRQLEALNAAAAQQQQQQQQGAGAEAYAASSV